MSKLTTRCRPVLARILGPVNENPCPKGIYKKRNLLYPPGERFPVTQTCKQVAETGAGDPRQGRPCKHALTLLCSHWRPWGKEDRWGQQQSSQATVSRLHLLWLAVEICRGVARSRASEILSPIPHQPSSPTPSLIQTPSSTLPDPKLSGNSKLRSQCHPSPVTPGHHQTPVYSRSHSGQTSLDFQVENITPQRSDKADWLVRIA